MAHFALNHLESHLLFRGGYIELKAQEWTRVMTKDVKDGVFEESEARNQVTLFEGDEAPANPYTKNAIVFATSPMDSGMTAAELKASNEAEVAAKAAEAEVAAKAAEAEVAAKAAEAEAAAKAEVVVEPVVAVEPEVVVEPVVEAAPVVAEVPADPEVEAAPKARASKAKSST